MQTVGLILWKECYKHEKSGFSRDFCPSSSFVAKGFGHAFREGYSLTNKKDLSQPGQFACAERVDVVGPKRTLEGVTVLGPLRKTTQIELSMTDARSIGLEAPVRESGDIEGSAGCKLVGPKGEIELKQGVIVAKRHIHMTPEDATEFGVKDKDVVSVKIDSEGRSLVFGDVVVRVSDNSRLPCISTQTNPMPRGSNMA